MSKDPSKIDYQELENWLSSRGASEACPSCGENDWRPPDRGLGLVVLDNGQIRMDKVFVVATFICGNCAFLRLHSPGVLRAQLGQ